MNKNTIILACHELHEKLNLLIAEIEKSKIINPEEWQDWFWTTPLGDTLYEMFFFGYDLNYPSFGDEWVDNFDIPSKEEFLRVVSQFNNLNVYDNEDLYCWTTDYFLDKVISWAYWWIHIVAEEYQPGINQQAKYWGEVLDTDICGILLGAAQAAIDEQFKEIAQEIK